MKRLQKIGLLNCALFAVACLMCQSATAYEHKGLQYSAGIGANFSRNNFLQDDESSTVKINRGYNLLLDYGYGWSKKFTTFLSFHNNFYQSSLKDYDTPEPFWMQQSFTGPSIRYYFKANEPSFYMQTGYGLGYFSVSDIANFDTSRHFGNATIFTIGYEIDMFWNAQINYMHNDIISTSSDNIGLSSQTITLSLNFNPRSGF